ncbi:hypothetical protein As57867_007015, partial [Aphanomyces stellatus]
MTRFLETGQHNAIDNVHAHFARLVVNRKSALNLVRDPDMNVFIEVPRFQARLVRAMTLGKMDSALLQMFTHFVQQVSGLFIKARAMYVATPNISDVGDNTLDWLTVCHDGWDSTIKHSFGVFVNWIDLHIWTRYKLGMGLAIPGGHNAEACKEAALVILGK